LLDLKKTRIKSPQLKLKFSVNFKRSVHRYFRRKIFFYTYVKSNANLYAPWVKVGKRRKKAKHYFLRTRDTETELFFINSYSFFNLFSQKSFGYSILYVFHQHFAFEAFAFAVLLYKIQPLQIEISHLTL
jgi:hypothetical protein